MVVPMGIFVIEEDDALRNRIVKIAVIEDVHSVDNYKRIVDILVVSQTAVIISFVGTVNTIVGI